MIDYRWPGWGHISRTGLSSSRWVSVSRLSATELEDGVWYLDLRSLTDPVTSGAIVQLPRASNRHLDNGTRTDVAQTIPIYQSTLHKRIKTSHFNMKKLKFRYP